MIVPKISADESERQARSLQSIACMVKDAEKDAELQRKARELLGKCKSNEMTRRVDEWGVLPDSRSLQGMRPLQRLLLSLYGWFRVSLLGQLALQTYMMAQRIAFVAKLSASTGGIPVVCPEEFGLPEIRWQYLNANIQDIKCQASQHLWWDLADDVVAVQAFRSGALWALRSSGKGTRCTSQDDLSCDYA